MKFSSLAALLLAGCIGSSVGSKQSAIVGGTTDSGDPAVVLVIIGDPNGGYIYMCTGEVISPHVVLTAGHCTTGSGPVSYTHLRAHETGRNLVCRLLLE